mmetsp:Transcript_27582/g.72228  ORF Transcript_27582/g.72228 Transcript_27582/m.72228 type:complete len:215 (-) Transcript_27582:1129-1773(-)
MASCLSWLRGNTQKKCSASSGIPASLRPWLERVILDIGEATSAKLGLGGAPVAAAAVASCRWSFSFLGSSTWSRRSLLLSSAEPSRPRSAAWRPPGLSRRSSSCASPSWPPVWRKRSVSLTGSLTSGRGARNCGNSPTPSNLRANLSCSTLQEPLVSTVSKAVSTGISPELLMRATKSHRGVNLFSALSMAPSEACTRLSGTLRPVRSARTLIR